MWLRVFGTHDIQPDPVAVSSLLEGVGAAIRADFHGDDTGWLRAEIVFAPTTPVYIERFLSSEEGIRAELNAWAAYLETCDYSPKFGQLMEHMIQTKQLFTIRRPFDASNEVLVENICGGLARFLARTTNGVYQIDQ